MTAKIAQPPRLRDLPLWRLLVALADAERVFGPADPTTRRIAEAVQERLTGAEDDATRTTAGEGHRGQ
jgi:hypothetical protein